MEYLDQIQIRNKHLKHDSDTVKKFVIMRFLYSYNHCTRIFTRFIYSSFIHIHSVGNTYLCSLSGFLPWLTAGLGVLSPCTSFSTFASISLSPFSVSSDGERGWATTEDLIWVSEYLCSSGSELNWELAWLRLPDDPNRELSTGLVKQNTRYKYQDVNI